MDTLKVSATFGVFELGLLQLNKKYLYSGIKKRGHIKQQRGCKTLLRYW